MDINEHVNYWTTLAASDWKAARNLFNTRSYPQALFYAHLYLEKLLKALIVQRTGKHAPYGHKLYTLAQKAGLALTEEQHDLLTRVTAYNIKTRYPDQRLALYKRLNRKFTESEMKEIGRIGKWIVSQIA
jgi:HEPN domain-containing protein